MCPSRAAVPVGSGAESTAGVRAASSTASATKGARSPQARSSKDAMTGPSRKPPISKTPTNPSASPARVGSRVSATRRTAGPTQPAPSPSSTRAAMNCASRSATIIPARPRRARPMPAPSSARSWPRSAKRDKNACARKPAAKPAAPITPIAQSSKPKRPRISARSENTDPYPSVSVPTIRSRASTLPTKGRLALGPEARDGERIAHAVEPELDAVADPDSVRVAVGEVAEHARAGPLCAVELDHGRDVGHHLLEPRVEWVADHREAVDRPAPGQLGPCEGPLPAGEAVGLGRVHEGLAARAALQDQPSVESRLPEGPRRVVGERLAERRGIDARSGFAHRYLRSSVPLTGRPAGPPVTSAISAFSTWFTATPRSCSTASRTWVMPMM